MLGVAAPTVVVTVALRQLGPQMVHDADEGKRLLYRSKSGFVRLHVATGPLAFFVTVTIVNVFGEFFNQSIHPGSCFRDLMQPGWLVIPPTGA
jgi:hypothetical protein